MQWTDEGIVLGVRRHGETSVILELMTREHGRHLGLVRGGAARACAPCCSPAIRCAPPGGRGSTSISATTRSKASTCAPPASSPAAHAAPRRHASRGLVPAARRARAARGHSSRARAILDSSTIRLRSRRCRAIRARSCSAELGFGLDLDVLRGDRRQATISIYVSPTLGPRRLARRRRAVSRQAAAAAAISCTTDGRAAARAADVADAFALTGFFLDAPRLRAARAGAAGRPRALRRRRSCSRRLAALRVCAMA